MQLESQPADGAERKLIIALPLEKPALRRHMRNVRAAMSQAERATASAAICSRLMHLDVMEPHLLRGGAPVAVYLAKPSEANIDRFIEVLFGQGVAVAAPRDVAPVEVSFYSLRDLHSTPRLGKFGVRSPLEYSGGKVYEPRHLGVVLTPGLAFDRNGGRLGQGGGWYDQVLPSVKLSIGICFDCQLIDSIPQEAHDARVDMIVTESQTIDIRGCPSAKQ